MKSERGFVSPPLARALVAGLAAAALAGCSIDPGMALIPTPSRPATVLPTEVAPVRADGYPNILADPATAPGTVREPAAVAADEAALAERGRRTEAAAATVRGPGFAADLARRGRTHVEETRAAIEAGARPQTGAAFPPASVLARPAPPAAAPSLPPADPGRPLDAREPVPRTVGGPAFLGSQVAPDE